MNMIHTGNLANFCTLEKVVEVVIVVKICRVDGSLYKKHKLKKLKLMFFYMYVLRDNLEATCYEYFLKFAL